MPTTTTTVSTRDARIGAAAMLGIAAIWPVLPVHPPFACPLYSITGIPCPLCGMTRGVAVVHGNFLDSLRFNPAGIFVTLLAVALLVGLRPTRLRMPVWLPIALGTLLWAWNIGFNPTFH